MVKKFLTVISSLCMAFGMSAESKCMIVELMNESAISFPLTEKPVITFQNRNLVVNKDAETTYSFDDVKNFHFSECEATGVETLTTNVIRVYQIDDETIEVQNVQPKTIVTLTSSNGVVLFQTEAGADGIAVIKTAKLTGVYILSAGNQSFKIIYKN